MNIAVKPLLSMVLLFGLIASAYSQDNNTELLVIVNVDNTAIDTIDKKQLRKLFLGKSLKLPGGALAVLATYKPLETKFNREVLRRSNAQVSAVWSRLKFSGRAKEPERFSAAAAIISFMSEHPNAIAYLPSSELTDDVRVVLRIP